MSASNGFRRAGSPRRAGFTGVVLALALVAAGCSGSSGSTVVVTHGPVPKPAYIDNGDTGPSAGDVRLFNVPATGPGGAAVATNWVMTTTAEDAPEKGVESRITSAVFSFSDTDTLLLQGVGLYPGEGATLKPATSVARAIIGGTGKYEGATGWVESTHNADDTWTHTFHID